MAETCIVMWSAIEPVGFMLRSIGIEISGATHEQRGAAPPASTQQRYPAGPGSSPRRCRSCEAQTLTGRDRPLIAANAATARVSRSVVAIGSARGLISPSVVPLLHYSPAPKAAATIHRFCELARGVRLGVTRGSSVLTMT